MFDFSDRLLLHQQPLAAMLLWRIWKSRKVMGSIESTSTYIIFHANDSIGYGMCFRNHLGQLLLGKSGYLHLYVLSLEAETIALLESIKMAISNGFHSVWFETVCKLHAYALSSSIVPNTEFGVQSLNVESFNLLITTLQRRLLRGKLIRLLIVLLEHLYLILTPMFSMVYHLLCTFYL